MLEIVCLCVFYQSVISTAIGVGPAFGRRSYGICYSSPTMIPGTVSIRMGETMSILLQWVHIISLSLF